MKKFFYMAVAAIAALSSCSQDEVFQNETNETKDGVFTATIEQPSGTRTTLGNDGLTVKWENGDIVEVNGYSYTATVTNSKGTSAILKPTVAGEEADLEEDGAYMGIYPYYFLNSGIDEIRTLPAVQTYKENTISNLPMIAFSTEENMHLEFKNICSVLGIKVSSSQVKTVKSITLKANQGLSGPIEFATDETGAYYAEIDTDYEGDDEFPVSNQVILDCGNGVATTDGGTMFYIAVPVGTYTSLTVDVFDGTNDYIMTSNDNVTMDMKRNTIYPVVFKSQSQAQSYFCLTSMEDNSTVYMYNAMTIDAPQLEYNLNNEGWLTFKLGGESVTDLTRLTLNKGDFVLFRAPEGVVNKVFAQPLNGSTLTSTFNMRGAFEASGNIMTLLNGDNPASELTSDNKSAFAYFFSGCSALADVQNLRLSATTLSENCYEGMFRDCTSLKTTPVLPATTLAKSCYYTMFSGCELLIKAPSLPATTLADYCYLNMFSDCSSLSVTPLLPATTLKEYCYANMFQNTNVGNYLTIDLPATTLAIGCYQNMFNGCVNFHYSITLPATILVSDCYKNMFKGCEKLEEVTMYATTVSNSSLTGWLENAGTKYGLTLYVPSTMVSNATIVENTPSTISIKAIE